MSLCIALTLSAMCVIIPALLLWKMNDEDPK
jgi:hypothetical protein